MNQSEQNLSDVHFIYERIAWYSSITSEERIEHFKKHRLDGFYSIPGPSRGVIICGADASKKFAEIAERYLSSQKDNNKTDLLEFVSNLKSEFSNRFIKREEEKSPANVARMISKAHERTAKKFESIQHFIPCSIFSTKTINGFDVGPVKFLNKARFFDLYGKNIESLREEIKADDQARCKAAVTKGFPEDRVCTEEQSEQLANRLVDGLLDFYTQHEWFAIIEIDACSPDISYDKAIFSVKTALNILKLLLGAEYADRLRTAEDSVLAVKKAKLTRHGGEKFDICLSSSSDGNVIGDNWLEMISNDAKCFFDLAAQALSVSLKFGDAPHLCARFVDALSWYGDAVYETSKSAKVVKYVSAIERMTVTGKEQRGVTDIVVNRSSILYSLASEKPLSECLEEIKKLYGCRSNLVHGSISPFDDSVASYSHKAEEISRMILLTGLDVFNGLGLDNFAIKEKQLKKYYNNLEKTHASTNEENAIFATFADIETRAKTLPPEDRARLAESLLKSLTSEPKDK